MNNIFNRGGSAGNDEIRSQTAAADAAADAGGEREVREVRHTISSEETFTLAKDVYDLRCVIKKIYSNRAQIARRLNILSLCFSLAFTAAYVALILYLSITNHLSQGWNVAVYVILGVYGALVAALGACTVLFSRGNTKSYKRNGKILKIFRFGVRAASLVMSVFALSVTYTQGAEISLDLAVRTVVAIVSVISIILSLIPLIFGGLGGVARWLLSPTKVNKRFSAVALEWYGYASGASPAFASTNKVEVSRLEDIGRCVDSYILPALGRRKLSSVGVNQIFAAIDMAAPSDRSTVEGILKNVFDYAVECKYIASNPCRDLNLQGTIEVYEKPKKESLKVRIGKKIGSSIIKQFLGEDDGKK